MVTERKIPVSSIGNTKSTRKRTEYICLKTYSADNIKKCCYRFSSNYFSGLEFCDSKALITFTFPSTVSETEEEEILSRFHQDLLDQDLRETIANRTEVIRNLILANAFSKTDLIDTSDE